jgi:hypothetical protein
MQSIGKCLKLQGPGKIVRFEQNGMAPLRGAKRVQTARRALFYQWLGCTLCDIESQALPPFSAKI